MPAAMPTNEKVPTKHRATPELSQERLQPSASPDRVAETESFGQDYSESAPLFQLPPLLSRRRFSDPFPFSTTIRSAASQPGKVRCMATHEARLHLRNIR